MKRILIVDDQPPLRFLFKEIFGDASQYEVKVAGTCMDAKKICETFTPDLAVVDVALPDQDGRMLLLDLKASSKLEHCKIVLMSGIANADEATLLSEVTVDLFLAKPFDIPEATKKVFALLETK